MTQTKLNVPAEVIEQAAKAYFLASEAEMGFTDSTWFGELGATEETRKQFRWAASQMAPIIAAWARQQALEEAVHWVEGTYTNPDGDALSRAWTGGVDAAAQRLRALVRKEA